MQENSAATISTKLDRNGRFQKYFGTDQSKNQTLRSRASDIRKLVGFILVNVHKCIHNIGIILSLAEVEVVVFSLSPRFCRCSSAGRDGDVGPPANVRSDNYLPCCIYATPTYYSV